jgi:hypothetical protein
MTAWSCVPSSQVSSDAQRVTIVPRDSVYHPGETVEIEIANLTSEHLRYNFCRQQLEIRKEGIWILVDSYPPDLVCTSDLLEMRPHARLVVRVKLKNGLDEGVYRLIFLSPVDGVRLSATFRITRQI